MVWVALVIFFLIASAALAIDTSGSFGAARTDQNTADLACLAGVRELPDHNAAIDTAVQYIDANWPQMAGSTLTLSLPTAVYDRGDGNRVFLNAQYGGDDQTLYIRVTEVNPTTFGKAIGQNSITVVQEAACRQQKVRNGTGILPVGALTGSWGGDLFDCAAKVTGNCGGIDAGSGANDFGTAVSNGMAGNFIKHHGNQNAVDPDTGYAKVNCVIGNLNPCNVKDTESGNMVGKWRTGQQNRFKDIVGADCVEAGVFNCDSINQVFGAGLQPLSAISDAQITWWESSLYGSLAAAKAATNPNAKHWFYNGDQMKCDSPRLATIPIVNADMNWDLGDPRGNWPNGKKSMKFIGFYTVYIREPDVLADIGKDAMDADIIWFGPDAKCDTGEAFQPLGSSEPINAGIRLVAP